MLLLLLSGGGCCCCCFATRVLSFWRSGGCLQNSPRAGSPSTLQVLLLHLDGAPCTMLCPGGVSFHLQSAGGKRQIMIGVTKLLYDHSRKLFVLGMCWGEAFDTHGSSVTKAIALIEYVSNSCIACVDKGEECRGCRRPHPISHTSARMQTNLHTRNGFQTCVRDTVILFWIHQISSREAEGKSPNLDLLFVVPPHASCRIWGVHGHSLDMNSLQESQITAALRAILNFFEGMSGSHLISGQKWPPKGHQICDMEWEFQSSLLQASWNFRLSLSILFWVRLSLFPGCFGGVTEHCQPQRGFTGSKNWVKEPPLRVLERQETRHFCLSSPICVC